MTIVNFIITNLVVVCRLTLASHTYSGSGDYHLITLNKVKSDSKILEATGENFKNGKINFVTRGGGPAGSLGHTSVSAPVIESSTNLKSTKTGRDYNLRDIYKHISADYRNLNSEAGHSKPIIFYEAIEHLRDSQFVGEILVGTPGQKFKPLFDTGSANTWIVSIECNLSTCKNVSQFDPSKSSTFKVNGLKHYLSVYFGSGMIKGYIASDIVEFCGTRLENQNIALVQYQGPHDNYDGTPSLNIFEKLRFEGLFGLAFPEMSATGDTVFQNFAKKNNLIPEFAFYLSPTDEGQSFLLIGGVDKKYYEGEIRMVSVVREHYWEVALDEFWVGDTKLCCNNRALNLAQHGQLNMQDAQNGISSSVGGNYIIVDSGTSFNALPHRDYEKFIKLVPEIPESEFTLEKIAKYPTIKYVLGDITLQLVPEQYMILRDGFYRAGFMQIDVPSQFGHAYILGSNIFMKYYFTVFRHSHNGLPPMIGFAKARH